MGKAEGKVERRVVARCAELGFFQCKLTSPALNGMPDRLVVANGHVAFIETKAPAGRLSAIQLKVHSWMRAAGAEVLVPYDTDQVDAIMDDLAARPPLARP